MSDIQAAIQQAAGSIVDYRINDLWGHKGDIADLIRKAIMPAVEKQAEIIKHMIEDQCEHEKSLETLVGSTAQGDSYNMESIYDVVKRRWDELTAQLTIERAAHRTACEAVEQLKQERDAARAEAAAMRRFILNRGDDFDDDELDDSDE